MASETVTVTVNADWTYDRAYVAGETATIPRSVYESVTARFPGALTIVKADGK